MPALHFESLRLYREAQDLNLWLHAILMDLLENYWPDQRQPARVTCIWRTDAENRADGAETAIHCQPPPYRAVDLGAAEFTQQEIDAAAAAVNARWQYDPARPDLLVCFVQPHGTGPHFHLQVHPHTRRREE